jgi:hypothetical protein
MIIRIELFGVARHLAGVSMLELKMADCDESVSLGRVLRALALQQPGLSGECIVDGALGPSFVANLGGERFVRDPKTMIQQGQDLIVFSADAGG